MSNNPYNNVNEGGKDLVFYTDKCMCYCTQCTADGWCGTCECSCTQNKPGGWFHHDETWEKRNAYGPFPTRNAAEEACKRYMGSLG